ncbi:MAG: DUF2061 domain-containing protein [Lutibacter sp.]|jgi:uncharacterized membrane protein
MSRLLTKTLLRKQTENDYDADLSSEKPIRSIVKAISWRIVGTIDTVVISWIITKELTLALSIGSIEIITKIILYYGHERIWNLIKWRK